VTSVFGPAYTGRLPTIKENKIRLLAEQRTIIFFIFQTNNSPPLTVTPTLEKELFNFHSCWNTFVSTRFNSPKIP